MSEPGAGSGAAFAYGRPIAVEGGIRARSVRGAIGTSWWSRRFLDVLESFALGARLTRGRNYARRGQVLELAVGPGTVSARVQGSRPTPYRVRITIPTVPQRQWRRIETELAAQARYSAMLLAGAMPPDIEGVFAAAGVALFPQELSEVDMRCGCPDVAVPCKHIAATFYLLGEEFDADPFQILRWRGRDRQALLDRLRELRAAGAAVGGGPAGGVAGSGGGPAGGVAGSGAGSGGGPAGGVAGRGAAVGGWPAGSGAVPAVGARAALAGVRLPAPGGSDRSFSSGVPLPRRPPVLAADVDLLLRQLPLPPAEIGGSALVDRLRRAYRILGGDPPG